MNEVMALTITEAVRASGIGRTRLYELIRDGRIDARKDGSRTLVMPKSLRKYIASLPRRATGQQIATQATDPIS
jgi:excisionase family DNA binding protein